MLSTVQTQMDVTDLPSSSNSLGVKWGLGIVGLGREPGTSLCILALTAPLCTYQSKRHCVKPYLLPHICTGQILSLLQGGLDLI